MFSAVGDVTIKQVRLGESQWCDTLLYAVRQSDCDMAPPAPSIVGGGGDARQRLAISGPRGAGRGGGVFDITTCIVY